MTFPNPIAYLVQLNPAKQILWCYLLWYVAILTHYFDPSPELWFNAAGISLVIGVALNLSVDASPRRYPWQTIRLFLIPFCVSSFASLIKGQGFFLIIPPDRLAVLTGIVLCGLFLVCVQLAKGLRRSKSQQSRR